MQKFPLGKARGKQEGSTGENTVGKSKAFRKISETWDICDWKFYGERSWNPNREEKINGKNAITENDLEEMHEAMDEL